jgi:site-specific DNA-methyltransferase (adenine-specific)
MDRKWVDLATKVLDAFGSVEAVKAARNEIEEVIVSGLSADQQAVLADDFIPDGRSGAGKAAIKVLADRAGVSPAKYMTSPEHKAKLNARKNAQSLVSKYWKQLIERISPPEEREMRPMTGNPAEDLAAFAENHGIKEDSEDFLALMNSINNLRLNPPVAPVQRALFPPVFAAPANEPAPPPMEPDPTPRDVSFLVNALHNPNHRYPSILAIGRAGSGKTVLIRSTIEAICSKYAESGRVLRVIVVSGTATVNPAQWQGMRIGEASFRLLDYDADEVKTIWEEGQAMKEHTIIVFDDVTGQAEKDKSLMQMYTQGRHCKMQVMLLAQSITGVANPTVRGNAQCVLFTRLNDDNLASMFKTAGINEYSKKIFIAWNKAYSKSYAFTATINGTMFLVKAIASVPVAPGTAAEAPPPEEEDDEDYPESEVESEADDDAPQPVPPVSTFVMGMTTYQRDAEDSIFDDGVLIGKAGEGIFKDLIDTPWMTSVPRSAKKKIAPVVAPDESAEDAEDEDKDIDDNSGVDEDQHGILDDVTAPSGPSTQTILCGDVLDTLATLPDRSYSCIVTSPPYNIGINYGGSVNDKKSSEEYLNWIKSVFLECSRVLSDDGSLFINVGYTSASPWIALDVANVIRSFMVLQNQMTWVKNISIGDVSHGQFKPINSERYLNVTNEMLFHFTKSGHVRINKLDIGVPFMYKANLVSRSADKHARPDVRCRGNSWFIPYETIQSTVTDRGGHPATFPIRLADMCIRLALGKEKGRVLDPFMGSGTTLVAAQRLGLDGTGIDINTEYVKFAKQRLGISE